MAFLFSAPICAARTLTPLTNPVNFAARRLRPGGRNLKKEFTSDGVLLNEAAYAVMAPLAEAAIARALGAK